MRAVDDHSGGGARVVPVRDRRLVPARDRLAEFAVDLALPGRVDAHVDDHDQRHAGERLLEALGVGIVDRAVVSDVDDHATRQRALGAIGIEPCDRRLGLARDDSVHAQFGPERRLQLG